MREKIPLKAGDRVYVDLDDVLCETARTLLKVLETDFGKTIRYEDVRSFDLGKSLGLAKEELAVFMRRIHEPAVLVDTPPIAEAFPVLESWLRAGCEVRVVTGRPPSSEEPTREWLKKHSVPHSAAVFVDKYSRALDGWSSAGGVTLEALSKTGFALAIDDAPTMLRFLLDEMTVPVVAFDRPWNAGLEAGRPYARCASWREIAAAVSLTR